MAGAFSLENPPKSGAAARLWPMMDATHMRDFPRATPKLALPVVLAMVALTLVGCGRKQSATNIVPAYQEIESAASLSSSPMANAVIVLLPLEMKNDVKEVNIDVPQELQRMSGDKDNEMSANVAAALAEQHRESLREMGVAAKVYASLTDAEKDNPRVSPLMLRGVVQEYKPKYQKRMGEVSRVTLDMKVRYDVWNPRQKNDLVTMWIETDPSVNFVEFQAPGGVANESQVSEKVAGLLQEQFEQFNNKLVGNSRVAGFVGG
jgi:type IV pilus biogenesis protein CpaD/CtpE